jgi:hypothetical protein
VGCGGGYQASRDTFQAVKPKGTAQKDPAVGGQILILPPEEQKGTAKDLRQLQAVGHGKDIPVGHQQAKLSVGLGDRLGCPGGDPQIGQLGLQKAGQTAVGTEDDGAGRGVGCRIHALAPISRRMAASSS